MLDIHHFLVPCHHFFILILSQMCVYGILLKMNNIMFIYIYDKKTRSLYRKSDMTQLPRGIVK